ncbi:DUF1028 domain-containing protein [Chryseobacterium sp. Tr-659]|uniref:DUF1028 domain-containing protein n=1 Tax=Chryseobacterium sp. Tr-659 TaxID=2608340 RepID=UPI00142313B6|nr:DUF1028 domain-containing protein [Chryseobacterium sp. Tr-659]
MKSLLLLILTMVFLFCRAQNLQSTLLNKDINATFSILAYDNVNKEWGIVIATNNIYVGNSTVYIRPGVGAFLSICNNTQLNRFFDYNCIIKK